MTDKLIVWAWRTSVLTLILATGLGAVGIGYAGLTSLLAHHWQPGAGMALAALSLGFAAWMLIRNRDDLVGA